MKEDTGLWTGPLSRDEQRRIAVNESDSLTLLCLRLPLHAATYY